MVKIVNSQIFNRYNRSFLCGLQEKTMIFFVARRIASQQVYENIHY